MFSNQAVLFPVGTHMLFMQASAPIGWVRVNFDYHRYIVATPYDDGLQYFGNYTYYKATHQTVLQHGHLPAVWFHGSTDVQGLHSHTYTNTNINYAGGEISVQRPENDYRAFARYTQATVDWVGNHAHNFSVHSGGANWGHDHIFDISDYRPGAITGIICRKA